MDKEKLKLEALAYHQRKPHGKIATQITKSTNNQYDLALAYSPGVAEPVREIVKNPETVNIYTAKRNLVGVITDGSAVLGLGNVGPLAAKPVMEGKAVLFKKFADIDVFDIEIQSNSPSEFINTVARISPTFGGINLEDIKAPECFEIEEALKEQLDIPVFHDDQHGTAIIIAAGLLNALEIQGKSLENAKIVCIGAGAAGIASMKLLLKIGAKKTNIFLLDSKGLITTQRENLNPYKFAFACDGEAKQLDEVIPNADVFVGLATKDLLTPKMLLTMAAKPIVFALSNPEPEILPEIALETRDDVIIATGRSDYPNQVNNVLCFPYMFKGALSVGANCINDEMLIAATHAIKDLAREPILDEVRQAYPNDLDMKFGKNYFIPKPLDPRLSDRVTNAVIKAAIASKVAKENNAS